MRLIQLLLVCAFFVSCAGGQKKSNNGDDFGQDLEGLTNESFKWPRPKGYNAVDDFLEGNLSGQANVLNGESLAKVDSDELESPMDVPKDLDQALLACYRGNHKLADQIFDRVMKEYRENPIYWNQVGNCFMMRGSERKALLYFNKARELKDRYAPPINNIGVIFEKGKYYQKALKSYEEAKKQSSFSLTPIFNLAQIYARFGFIDEGKQLFNSLVRINSKDQDALAGLAFFELATGDYNGALRIYGSMNSDYLNKDVVKVNHAYAQLMSGNRDRARELLSAINNQNDKEFAMYLEKLKGLVK